jgi:hypothetical protein
MTQLPGENIPEEILRSEGQSSIPPTLSGPDVLGLPGLPQDVIDFLVRYGPYMILCAGAFIGFGAVKLLMISPMITQRDTFGPVSAYLDLAAAVIIVASYVPLIIKRRTGWNLLAAGLGIFFFSQFLAAGVGSIVFFSLELLVAAYVMVQVRDYFSS